MHFSSASIAAMAITLLASTANACTVSAWSESDCSGDFTSSDGNISGCHTFSDGRTIAALEFSEDCTGGNNIGVWASTNCDGDRTEYNVGDNAGRCVTVPAGRFSYGCDHC